VFVAEPPDPAEGRKSPLGQTQPEWGVSPHAASIGMLENGL